MLPLMMALAGLVKGETIDRQKEARDRELAANTQRLSPWTHMQAGPIKEADPLGNAMSFGMAGIGLDQNMQDQAMKNTLTDAQVDYMKAMQGRPGASSNSGGPAPTPVIPAAGRSSSLTSPWGYRRYGSFGEAY